MYVTFPEHYMEVKHVRQYNFESLVGNAGGYLGLFLGYALLQLPEFIRSVFLSVKINLFKMLDVKC